jgi:pimeloyl-ACP methyl ester carboxylesterase
MVHAPGGDLFVQLGGTGEPVLLLHGYVQSGDMWGPLAAELAGDHTLIVPDLRGMARSARPVAEYEKKSQAQDLRQVIQTLGFDRVSVVGFDIGVMVAYAYAAQYPASVSRLVVADGPIPGVEPWEELLRLPVLWHWNFRGPHAERLVEGRERIYFDRHWDDATMDPSMISERKRDHYAAQYAAPGAMAAGFGQFGAFTQDAQDNELLTQTKLTMPVLALGGETGFGSTVAVTMRHLADDVREAIVPDSGHFVLEENPTATIAFIRDFLDESS